MPIAPFRFLSVHAYCHRVASPEAVLATPNSVCRPEPDAPNSFDAPDFVDDSDRRHAEALVSPERNRDTFGVGLDASQDHFLARLDDVTVERWTLAGTECFRIFVDRGVALTEPFTAHYKADWPLVRAHDTIFADYKGQRVPIYLHDEQEPEVVFNDPAVYMLDKNASSYYHWMCEVLPRLWACAAVPELSRLPMVVNDRNLSTFQRQTLGTMLGSAQLVAFP